MNCEYKPHGVCSTKITFRLDDDGTVHNIVFTGGCPGNLKAIPKLIDGWKADDIINKLLGNDCAGKGTSCADQLARALIQAKDKLQEK